MGLPTWVVDGTFDVKYGGLEPAMILVLNFALLPYLRHFEQKYNQLLSPGERGVYYFEYDFSALLRTDEKSRSEFYKALFTVGAMAPDEIAEKENLPASADGAGATRFVPAQNMPLENDVLNAYMAKAKAIAAGLLDSSAPKDPNPPLNSATQ
jgi:phage portal protein BeeE